MWPVGRSVTSLERGRNPVARDPDLSELFHRLNNQLGIILVNAELLEARSTDDATRVRAAQVVSSAIDAMATARDLRVKVESKTEDDPPLG